MPVRQISGFSYKETIWNEFMCLKHFSERGGEAEMNIYYIGGSSCAGKSSVAEIFSQKYGLYYFKVDDYLARDARSG